MLDVIPGQEVEFATASGIIASMPGYLSHELQWWVERPSRDALMAR